MAYIYMITNEINGKVYVGKTEESIQKRFVEHCKDSKKDRCKNRPLYRAMNKYGCENFTVSLLEETDQPELREEFWIDQKKSYHNGYNATRGGDGKKYLDYELIYNTYCKIQNATKTAKILGISSDTVRNVVSKKDKVLSSAEVVKATFSKAIVQSTLDGQIEICFESIADAARYVKQQGLTKINNLKGITKILRECANGKRNTAFGSCWHW